MAGTIWWTSFCGNRSDYDAFWSPPLTLETYNPDISLCMQRSLLLWIPVGWLWIVSIFYIRYLYQRECVHGFFIFSKLNVLKTVLGLAMIAVSIASLVYTCGQSGTVPIVNYVYHALRIVTLTLATFLTRWEFRKGCHTSSELCIFWMLYAVLQIIPFRSSLIRRYHQEEVWGESETEFILDTAFFALLLAELVLSWFADTVALAPTTKTLPDERTPLLSKSDSVEESTEVSPKEVPELRASFWMQTTFQWMLPAVWRGYRKTVTFDDLYNVRPEDACGATIPIYNRHYNRCMKSKGSVKWAFYNGVFQTVAWPLVYSMTLKFLSVALSLLNPQLLRLLLNFIESNDPYAWKAIFLAMMIFLTALLGSVVRHNFFYIGWNAGLKARSLVNAVVCRKALRLGSGSKKTTTVGEMVNFLSVDAQKIQDFFTFSHLMLDVPVQIVVTCVLIWNLVGWTAIAGLLLLAIIVPLNGFYFGDQVRKLQAKQMVHKDSRLKMINEVLNGIKILKLYAWEICFRKQIMTSRDAEVQYLKLANLMNAVSHSIWCIMPYLMSLAIFALYVMATTGHVLSADIAFVTLSYINSFQFSLANLPLAVSFTGQGFVSAARIAGFLELDELKEGTVEMDNSMKDIVQVKDASFSWDADDRVVLHDLDLNIRQGELVAVVGHVGAGKTSFLSALLGELHKVKGHIKLNGKLAYVPQQAWTQNATLRNNILFDSRYDHRKYKNILDVCALGHDLEVLPGGDTTEIGEKGINLSGGQKQRVSLARAVYQDEDIYLLDDPLSAVDAHVGKHIFDKVIGRKGVLQRKTRILVTHAITFLPHVDRIIVLNEGHVTEMGQYDELLENNGSFAEFLRTYLIEEEFDEESSSAEMIELHRRLSGLSGTESEPEMKKKNPTKTRRRKKVDNSLSQSNGFSDGESVSKDKAGTRLIEEERSAVGQMKPRVIWAFIKSGGLRGFLIIIFSQLLFVTSQVLTNLWLSAWTNDVPVNGSFSYSHASYRLGVYGGLGILQTVSAVLVMVSGMMGCTSASRVMHKSLLFRILRAPMSFFDTTPLGRIMNRFSKDMDMLDTNVPIYLRTWLFSTGPLLSSVVLISYTTPIFLVVLVVLMFPYGFLQRVYITYGSQLKRIDSVRRSPIYAHFDETVSGAVSIRAYRRQGAFIAKAEQLIDDSQRPFFVLSAAQRWLGVTMEALGSLVILSATMMATLQRDSIGPGLAGVSVTYALQITTLLNMMIRSSTELETYMVCVERIDEYCQIESEAPWNLPSDNAPQLKDWPTEGHVTFRKYGTRYRPGLDLVLNQVDLEMESGEKIGVVGRTGAGKSSLTLALFRIIEAAQGQISIDGEDLSKLGLHLLRMKLTVIPQDPVMFSGSLRMNLDPFRMYSDLDLWQSLEHAHLKAFVETLDEGLDYNCGEGGSALSVGQRQLVCLARALLRRSKVLILDEATAAVDLETDALIQTTIRKHFEKCTVITVAHRLNTVLDYDKILVLDQGRVKEFDRPDNLLAVKTSTFYSLAKEAGLI